jgi:hypothetical protein
MAAKKQERLLKLYNMKVVHCKIEPYDVYIGRGHGSPWGNPYSHKEGTLAKYKVDTVEEAISKYREYILSRQDLLDRLCELKGKVLGCWCKTKKNPSAPCHGDVLVELINERCK